MSQDNNILSNFCQEKSSVNIRIIRIILLGDYFNMLTLKASVPTFKCIPPSISSRLFNLQYIRGAI